MEMNVVGAVSRAGEKHSVLFCEYTGSKREEDLINAFMNGLKLILDRKNIYCLAVRFDDAINGIVGIYYHKDGKECMVYERTYEYLNDYVSEIFSEELKSLLAADEEGVGANDAEAT